MTYVERTYTYPLEGDELEMAAYVLKALREDHDKVLMTTYGMNPIQRMAFEEFKRKFYGSAKYRLGLYQDGINIAEDGKSLTLCIIQRETDGDPAEKKKGAEEAKA